MFGKEEAMYTDFSIWACGDFLWDNFEGNFETIQNPKDEE